MAEEATGFEIDEFVVLNETIFDREHHSNIVKGAVAKVVARHRDGSMTVGIRWGGRYFRMNTLPHLWRKADRKEKKKWTPTYSV